jgi:PAS domain-containing protein
MRRRLAALPPDAAILYAVLLVDVAGVPHEYDRALDILHAESNAPIFGGFETQMGHGIVGGPLYPIEKISSESTRLALRILDGESPGSIETVILGAGTPVYDWRELKRWKINESRLPPGSIVQFREPTFWALYHWYIVGALLLILLQAVLITGLVLNRIRRRRVEAELRENQELMEMATSAGGLGLWARDLNGDDVWANSMLRTLLGVGPNEPVRAGDLLARIHADDRVRVISEVQRAQDANARFEGEFRT